jgi:hypothetical protein
MKENMSFGEYLNSINPLTVGQLREAIANLPDSTQILMAPTPEGSYADWFNVSHTFGVPTGADDSEYSAFTLFPVDNYDSRQF